VRALFLYPLNALIKSQRDRLTAWTEPFGGRIRYCLYNGDTPRQGKSPWTSEVPDRKTLRTNPPPILVTNATMLEIYAGAHEDQPILAQSQGTLRWVVIDEAHNYIGSQAAELTLLLRRVLHAFAAAPTRCTSWPPRLPSLTPGAIRTNNCVSSWLTLLGSTLLGSLSSTDNAKCPLCQRHCPRGHRHFRMSRPSAGCHPRSVLSHWLLTRASASGARP